MSFIRVMSEEQGTFGDEGVIPGAGTGGEKMLDWGDRIMYDPNDAQVTMYYGVSTWVLLLVSYIMYFSLNEHFWGIANLFKGWEVHMICFWPVSIIWMATAFWDGKWLRDIFRYATIWSLGGPFAGFWVALSYLLLAADAAWAWDWWQFWITAVGWIAYTVFAMIIQAFMVPKVLNWIDTAPINPNKKKNDDGEEFLANVLITDF